MNVTPYCTKFDTTGSSERCREVLESVSKIQQRIYFSRRFRSFGASKEILQYGGSVWFSCLPVHLEPGTLLLLGICSTMVAHSVENSFLYSCTKHTLRLDDKIALDPSSLSFLTP